MPKYIVTVMLILTLPSLQAGDESAEIVSFRCSLAIDATFAELDRQAHNPVTQDAMSRIDENSGQFVCIKGHDSKIYVRLQSTDMVPSDNKLVFTIDTRSYKVIKTLYGP